METTKIQQEDVRDRKNFEVMKCYAAGLFEGVTSRKQLISCKEHRAALCYVALAYELIKISKKESGCKSRFKDWGELQGTRLRWLASYVVHSVCRTVFSRTARHAAYNIYYTLRHDTIFYSCTRTDELCIIKGIYLAVNGRGIPERPMRKVSDASLSPSEAQFHTIYIYIYIYIVYYAIYLVLLLIGCLALHVIPLLFSPAAAGDR